MFVLWFWRCSRDFWLNQVDWLNLIIARSMCAAVTGNNKGDAMSVSPTPVDTCYEDQASTKTESLLRSCGTANITAPNEISDETKQVKPNLSKRAQKRLKKWVLKNQKTSSDVIRKQSSLNFEAKIDKHSDLIVEESLHETDYYFESGLRKVYPYCYKFTAHAKGRWFGQKLVDVFVKEFQHVTPESFKKSIMSMAVTVNGQPTNADYVLQNGDFITNAVHRHELPVTAEPISVVADTDELLVINKPSSIPIHPCGRYRHNSVLYILAKEQGYRNLRSIYRLDRLTSGVVIFCKTEAKTREMMNLIKHHDIKKEYVCRVDGQFPSGIVECDGRIDTFSYKHGIYRVGPNGKESRTMFECMSYNGQTSVVKCMPLTGRTHQIRVHLQFLGFPITNDPLYNGPVWGPNKGRGGDFGKSEEQLIAELEDKHNCTHHVDDDVVNAAYNNSDTLSDDAFHSQKRIKLDSLPLSNMLPRYDPSKTTYEAECRECQLKFKDPQPCQLIMYLHAHSYKGPGWSFTTPLPPWADADWDLH